MGGVSSQPEAERESLLEMIDRLIEHLDSARVWLNVVSLSSVVVAPISIIFTLIMFVHPGLLRLLLSRGYVVCLIFLFYLIGNLVLAALWLTVGIKEGVSSGGWSQRFRRYRSLKRQLDEELRREFKEEETTEPS
ncbi:MAG: hypothetical protein QW057_03235 [Candidatus Bathyarchaeia archaeon]